MNIKGGLIEDVHTKSPSKVRRGWIKEHLELMKDKLSKKGYKLGKPIGEESAFGYTFTLGSDKIMKITTDKTEALSSSKLIDKKLKHVVKIFRVFQFKHIPNIWFIVQEKLQPLSSKIKNMMEKIEYFAELEDNRLRTTDINYFSKVGSKFRKVKDIESYLKKRFYIEYEDLKDINTVNLLNSLRNKIKDNYALGWLVGHVLEVNVEKLYEDVLSYPDIFLKILNSLKDLHDNNIVYKDAHGGNLMQNKKGILKWVDIGYESKVPGKAVIEKIESKIKVTSVAGSFYNIIHVGKDIVLVTYPFKRSGANLIAGSEGNNYYVLALKRNKHMSSTLVNLIIKNDGVPEGIFAISKEAKDHNILKYFYKLNEKKFINQVLIKESLSPIIFESAFPDLKKYVEEEEHQIGNFRVTYEARLKESEKKNIEEFIKTGSQIMQKFNLGKVLYGKIIIVDKLQGKTVADYTPGKDAIRVSRKARKNRNMIQEFIHELGHRMLEIDLVNKSEIMKKYTESFLEYDRRNIRSGDVFLGKDGLKRTIKDRRLRGTNFFYIFEKEGTKGLWKGNDSLFAPMKKIEGKKPGEKDLEWTPTGYSMTNYGEWFCEILSYGLVDNNRMYKDFVKSVLKK